MRGRTSECPYCGSRECGLYFVNDHESPSATGAGTTATVAPTVTPTASSAATSPSSRDISSQLTSGLQAQGYVVNTPLTKTVANGTTMYTGVVTKGGVGYSVQIIPTTQSNAQSAFNKFVSNLESQGFTAGSGSTSTQWQGTNSSSKLTAFVQITTLDGQQVAMARVGT